MGTQARNRSEFVESTMEESAGAAEQIKHGQPVLEQQQQAAPNEAPVESAGTVESIVSGAIGANKQEAVEPQHEIEPAASTVVDSVVSNEPTQMRQPEEAPQSVPAIPQDRNLNPGISSGRLQTQDASGYVDAAIGNTNTQANQIEEQNAEDAVYDAEVEEREQIESEPQHIEADAESYHEKKRQYVADNADDIVREVGSFNPPKPMNVLSRANRRFKESVKSVQGRIRLTLSGEKYHGSHGNAFHDTIFSLSTLMPDQVSIGTNNLREALREPNSNLLDIVNDANPDLNLDVETCLADINVLAEAINMSNIEVVFGKYPVNTRHSIQVRTLRVHNGSGIGLHPTQTKAYNADFDGDTGNLNLDQDNLQHYNRAMSHLIDSEGNASIDPDFFPLDSLALPTSKDRLDLIESMQERNFAWEPSVATKIADAYIDACNKGDWVGLLRKIDEIAGDKKLQDETGLYRGQLTSRILKNIYDFAIDRRGMNLRLEWANVIDSYEYIEPDEDTDPIVISLIDMVEEIAQGRPAPNFQDFAIFFNKQYGDIAYYDEDGNVKVDTKGKNIPFRLLADFAKAIKRTDLITVGDPVFGVNKKGDKADVNLQGKKENTVTLYDLWQFTCSAGVSKMISGRMYMGSHELSVSTYVKTKIRQMVPVPQWDMSGTDEARKVNVKAFREWIKTFQLEYNSQMRMLNVSQVRFRSGMMIDRLNLLRYDGFEHIDDKCAKAIVEVYGDLTVERVFPDTILNYGRKQANDRENTNNGIINRYGKMTIEEFAIKNRLDWYSEHNGDKSIPKMQAINSRIDSGEYTPLDILMLVSDRRSKQFGEYNESWLKVTSKHVEIMRHIKNDVLNHDFNEYANDMLELLHMMSPRMFDHFGMDSPITFSNSKWGKKLLECESESEFRSILVSMTIEYRFGRASNLRKKIDELIEESLDNSDRIVDTEAHYAQELDQLASSSMAWETIVSEIKGDTDGFKKLLEHKEIKRRGHSYKMYAREFWNSNSSETQYSLINFLKSSADYETKMAVLCDVVRYNTGIESIDVNHMIGMLAHDPDPLFAGSRFEMDNGIRSATDSVKDSMKRITSYQSKSPATIKKIANQIIEEAYEDKAKFEAKLLRFANEPDYHVYVDTVFAADAIASVYEKAYSDSEKIKQQTLVNAFFECLSLQRNGGFYTHLQQADNAVLNVVGFDQLTPIDIVRIIGDPSIELHGYDEFGAPCVYSRKALCGGETIDDVLRYLQDHPRVALACRRHMTSINAGLNKKGVIDGSARLSVLADDNAGVNYTNKVFSLLNDRYRFLAIAALITPSQGNVARNLAEDINANIKTLCLFVLNEAASGRNHFEIIKDIEQTFGFIKDKFMELRQQGAFDPNDVNELDHAAVAHLHASLIEELEECISIVQKSGMTLKKVPMGQINFSKVGIDKSSMLAYYDARQQLCGARTQKMIGIEGGETKKNLVLKEYVRNRPDRFMTITNDFSPADILALSELTQSDIRKALEDSDDGMIVIEVPDGWSPDDWTLEHNPTRIIGSVAKFLEVKREKGAETFNAKSKKYGDDGTQSIIKFFKYGTKKMIERYNKGESNSFWTIEDGVKLRSQIMAAGSKEAAIPILADALMKADDRLGYIDIKKAKMQEGTFQKSDYYNMADLMLVEIEEEGGAGVYVRTLEQLAVGFRNRLSDEAIASKDVDVVISELRQLESVIGTPNDIMNDPRSNITNIDRVRVVSGFGSVSRLERALRPYSSSTERNFKLVWDLFRLFGKDEDNDFIYRMPSRESIEKRSNEMYAKLEDKQVKDALKGIAYPNNKRQNRETIYDYLGRPSDENFQLIPGPQSLVYFDGTNPKDAKVIEQCKKYGITAAFSSLATVPSKYADDAIVLDEGMVILPFFDMRLNGSVSEAISPAPGQFFFQANNSMVVVENTTYDIRPGDASAHFAQEGLDKAHINFEGTEIFEASKLFPNVIYDQGQYKDAELTMCLATAEEIRDYVLTGEAYVDIGILENENDPKYKRELERYYIRLEEYAERVAAGKIDEDTSLLTDEDCKYDSIVGFAKIKIGANTFAFAPIIPFHVDKIGKAPRSFKPECIEMDDDSSSYVMRWKFTGDIRDHYIKIFEGVGASNKMIAYGGETIRSRTLANGIPVDMMYSTKSVASRLFPTNKRIHTMITMLMIPRLDPNYSYNFGDIDGAFPGDTHWIAERLSEGSLTLQDWADIVKENPNLVYHVNKQINDVVKWLVNKCVNPETGYQTVSPSVLLSTHRTHDGIREIYHPVGTEFEVFLDSGYNFQNALMKLMYELTKDTGSPICPPSIDDSSEHTLMKPVNKSRKDENYGVLQMMVPYWTADGDYYEQAENVYISFSFFGDEFSGFKKVNYDAANRGIDDLNVATTLDGFDLSQVLEFGRAGYSSVPTMNKIEVAEDNIMQDIKEE